MHRGFLAVAALALLRPAGAAIPAVGPVVVPFEVVQGAVVIRVKVDGAERRLMLATEWPFSFFKGVPDRAVDIEVNGVSLGKSHFSEIPGDRTDDSYGALGMDLLRGMAIGIDEYRREVTIWPRGATPTEAEAQAWIGTLPAWGGAVKVRRLSLGISSSGMPSLEMSSEGRKTPALLNLDFFNTSLEPSVASPGVPVAKGISLLPGASFAGLPPIPLFYRPTEADSLVGAGPEIRASIAQSALQSRRVLIDLKANAAYVEQLPEAARLAKLFGTLTRGIFDLKDGGLIVQLPPGVDVGSLPGLAPFVGASVVRIAGVPAKAWVDALESRNDTAAKVLASLVAKTFQDFPVDVLTSSGERTFNLAGN